VKSTFVEQARRAQIVGAAVTTLAELGYAAASVGRIAQRIGISRPLIHYHFRSREALIEAVLDHIYAAGYAAVRPGIDRAGTAPERLAAFITGSVAFYREHPDYIRALEEIVHGTRAADWQPVRAREDREIDALATVLRAGQEAGELGSFDATVMARTVRHALNGLLDAWHRDPALDLDHYTGELLRLFRAATTKGGDT
jgi:AcrR family transcriptional regulator